MLIKGPRREATAQVATCVIDLKLFLGLIVHCGYVVDVHWVDASTGTLQGEKCAHRACDRLVYCRSVVVLDERREAR